MVAHIRYSEQRYATATQCIEAIRSFLDGGWWLTAVSRSGGEYVVVFGVDDTPAEPAR